MLPNGLKNISLFLERLPGIGEKTAKQLISEYGSIENLIEKSSSLKHSIIISVRHIYIQIFPVVAIHIIPLNVFFTVLLCVWHLRCYL